MGNLHQMSVSVPKEMANEIKQKVQSGFYASESEVIRDGLRMIAARDRAVENWLCQSVIPAIEDYDKDKKTGVTIDEMLKLLD